VPRAPTGSAAGKQAPVMVFVSVGTYLWREIMDKKGTWLQAIGSADIWYCEGGSKQIYLGLVKYGRRHRIVSCIAETPQEAIEKMSEDGDILTAASLRDIISGLQDQEEDPILQ
jgi:hypothetical protein